MAKRAYELLVRFGQDESIAGAHVKEMHLDENGKDLKETAPIPLADTDNPAFTAFAEKFSAKAVSENEVLKSEKATLTQEKATLESQVASLQSQVETLTSEKSDLNTEKSELTTTVSTLTQEKTGLQSQVASLTAQVETLTTEKSELVASHAEEKSELILNHLAEKAELVATHNAEKATLATSHSTEKSTLVASHASEKATLNTALAAANARIVRLTNELPFNPREASVNSIKARLFRVLETEDVVRLYANETDPILKQIAKTIENWDHRYPIRLDSQELQQPLAYLVSIDLLTPEEVVFLRQDCTRDEAYFAPEEE